MAPGSLQGSHGAGPQADHRAWRWRGAGRGTRQLGRDASTTPNKADGTPPPVHKPPFAPGPRLGHRSLQHKASAPPRHINTPTFLPRPPTSVASSPKLLRNLASPLPFSLTSSRTCLPVPTLLLLAVVAAAEQVAAQRRPVVFLVALGLSSAVAGVVCLLQPVFLTQVPISLPLVSRGAHLVRVAGHSRFSPITLRCRFRRIIFTITMVRLPLHIN